MKVPGPGLSDGPAAEQVPASARAVWVDGSNLTSTRSLCLPGESRKRAAYRVPERIMRPLILLLPSLQVTDAIPRPVTRRVNGALTHPARIPVSLALAGADRYADT